MGIKCNLREFISKLGLIEVSRGELRDGSLISIPLKSGLGNSYLFLSKNAKVRDKGFRFLGNLTLKKKLFKMFLKLIINLRGDFIFPHYTWDSNSFFAFISSCLSDDYFFNCYLGTPGPYAKPVIQVCNFKGEEKFYVKVALNERVRSIIDNEISALEWLSTSKNKPFIHPKLILKGNWQGNLFLVQSAVPYYRSSTQLDFHELHIKVVKWLKKISFCKVQLFKTNYYEQLISFVDSSPGSIRSTLYEILRSIEKQEFIFHASHGDFVPWNIVYIENMKKIALIDWEYFSLTRPASWDLLHFLLRVELFIRNRSVKDLIRFSKFWKNLNYLMSLLYPEIKERNKYLVLYLLDRLAFHLSVKSPHKWALSQYSSLLKYLVREGI